MCPKQVTKQVLTVARERCSAEDYYRGLAHSFPFFQQFSRLEAPLVAVGCHRAADPSLGRKGMSHIWINQIYQLKHKPTHLPKYLCCHRPGTPNLPSDPQEDATAFSKNSSYLLWNYFHAVWH